MACVALSTFRARRRNADERTDRWFVHLFDTSMRETCRYTGPTPYWDWTRDHADLFNSPVFDASPEHGLGGTGICQSSFSGEADCTVATGALASSLGNFELAWPVAHGLRRNLTLFTGWFPHEKPLNTTLTPGFIRDATEKTTGDFFAFQQELTESHNAVHNFVGADLAGVCPNSMPSDDCNGMTQAFTPNDPLFWLHHAQLDRLWDKVSLRTTFYRIISHLHDATLLTPMLQWQHHHPLNFAAFSGRFLDAQDPQGPHYDPEADVDHHMLFDIHSVPMTPAMLLDIEAWPLCYQYVDE